MNKVGKQRMKLRVEYSRETDLIFSDNIPKYADWLEEKLALSQNDFITKLYTAREVRINAEEFELQRIYDWLLDENREPANTKFTAGKTRDVAREIELLLRKE